MDSEQKGTSMTELKPDSHTKETVEIIVIGIAILSSIIFVTMKAERYLNEKYGYRPTELQAVTKQSTDLEQKVNARFADIDNKIKEIVIKHNQVIVYLQQKEKEKQAMTNSVVITPQSNTNET